MKSITSLTVLLASLASNAFAIDTSSIEKIKITIDFDKNPTHESLVTLQELLSSLNQESRFIQERQVQSKHEIIIEMAQYQKNELETFIKSLNELIGDDSKASTVKLQMMKQGTQDWTK